MTPTDILGNIKLYNADNMEVMKTFKDNSLIWRLLTRRMGLMLQKWLITQEDNKDHANKKTIKSTLRKKKKIQT